MNVIKERKMSIESFPPSSQINPIPDPHAANSSTKSTLSNKIPTSQTQSQAPKPLSERNINVITSKKETKRELLRSKEAIETLAKPLQPTTHDVYFPEPLSTEAAEFYSVFKPGISNTIKAMLCHKVAKILGIDASVPKTIQVKAAAVLSVDDVEEGLPIKYEWAKINDADWLINPNDSFKLSEIFKDGDDYEVMVDEHDDKFLLSETENGTYVVKRLITAPEHYDSETDHERDTVEPEPNSGSENEEEYEPTPQGRFIEFDDDLFSRRDEEEVEDTDEAGSQIEDWDQPAEFENDEVLLATINGKDYIVRQEGAHPVIEGSFVKRGDALYPIEDKKNPTPMGKNVTGLLQPKIEGAITKVGDLPQKVIEKIQTQSPKKINTDQPIVLLYSPPVVLENFFNSIDANSFIDSLLLSILFRTQDGKANNLQESNFLFTKEDDKLKITMIDLDETWPTSNELNEDPEFVKAGEIAALRLGLMGYPQAHEILKGETKAHVIQLLEKVKLNQDTLVAALGKYKEKEIDSIADAKNITPTLENPNVEKAFKEVIERLIDFYDTKSKNEFSLADLVFHVFPTYKQQWDDMSKIPNIKREELADRVGCDTVEIARQARR